MRIFGFSALKTEETPAGSFTVSQLFSVPMEEGFEASAPFYAIPEIGWQSTVSSPLLAMKDSRTARVEALERITQLDAVELMSAAQTLLTSSALSDMRSRLNFSSEEMIVPYNQQGPARERWAMLLSEALAGAPDIEESLAKLRWITAQETVKSWLRTNARKYRAYHIPWSEPHQLDLLAPDLSRRVILSFREPWQALKIGGELSLVEFPNRNQMLTWAEEELDRPRGEVTMISSQMQQAWEGEPISTQLVRPYARKDLVLRAGPLMSPAADRGYLKARGEQEAGEELAPHALSGGMVHPAIPALKSRVIPKGKNYLYKPAGVWR